MVHAKHYNFQETVLDKPKSSITRRSYFTVTIEDDNNHNINVDTRAIFSTAILGYPHFEDFLNKMVLVEYNKKTGDWITIETNEK